MGENGESPGGCLRGGATCFLRLGTTSGIYSWLPNALSASDPAFAFGFSLLALLSSRKPHATCL